MEEAFHKNFTAPYQMITSVRLVIHPERLERVRESGLETGLERERVRERVVRAVRERAG